MRNYTTQMDAAKQGIITPEMKAVAKKEYRTEEEIRDLVAKGQVAICANRLHTCLDPNGVGSMLRTKINVNLGVSQGLQGLQRGDGEGDGSGPHGGGGHYGPVLPRKYPAIPAEADPGVPGHDRHGAGLRQRDPLPAGSWLR